MRLNHGKHLPIDPKLEKPRKGVPIGTTTMAATSCTAMTMTMRRLITPPPAAAAAAAVASSSSLTGLSTSCLLPLYLLQRNNFSSSCLPRHQHQHQLQHHHQPLLSRRSHHRRGANAVLLSTPHHQQRWMSSSSSSWFQLKKIATPVPQKLQPAIQHVVSTVQKHDPSGYLPGRLLPTNLQLPYYTTRSFWVETGFRFATTTSSPSTSTARIVSPAQFSSPHEYLEWWQRGIDTVFTQHKDESENLSPASTSEEYLQHPTLSLLHHMAQQTNQYPGWTMLHDATNTTATTSSAPASTLAQQYLDTILAARRKDLLVKQYNTLQDLIEHGQHSCAPSLQLVLISAKILPTTHKWAHEAAMHIGTCHGLTNALRTSIPIVSTTGKLILPQDLCIKHGVKSPRYLLSALGQGDDECVKAMQRVVQDIVLEARQSLQQGRQILHEQQQQQEDDVRTAKRILLLPGVVSETFLDRLEQANYLLTDRDLRNVGIIEHAKCATRLLKTAYLS